MTCCCVPSLVKTDKADENNIRFVFLRFEKETKAVSEQLLYYY